MPAFANAITNQVIVSYSDATPGIIIAADPSLGPIIQVFNDGSPSTPAFQVGPNQITWPSYFGTGFPNPPGVSVQTLGVAGTTLRSAMTVQSGAPDSVSGSSVTLTSESVDRTIASKLLLSADTIVLTQSAGGNPTQLTIPSAASAHIQVTEPIDLDTWHAMVLATNWANLGAPWGPAEYRLTATGHVEFSGAIQWTDGATGAPVPITTLPSGYIPNRKLHLSVITMPGVAVTPTVETIEVLTTGVVQLTNYVAGGPFSPITLEGLQFALNT